MRVIGKLLLLWTAVGCLGAPAPAGARPLRDHAAYALVVGSERGGPGQEDLRFAGADARRVRDVLVELGGFAPESVALLLEPGRDELLAALAAARATLAEHERRGEPAEFVFYYSGHARATALNMGAEELPLTRLREELTALPATLTIAVLDACQTGAISGVKGAEPAADFSYNSADALQTGGIALLASSSGSELSQESPALGASIFTHHLVTGLRGAADADADGRVTLSEVYRYAYDRTLVSSAATAVGKQHVTLETALRGKGETVLTWPARATSALALPEALAGDVLVHRAPDRDVVAEVTKGAGAAVRLALQPGDYVAWVRREGVVLRCLLDLEEGETTALAVEACEEVPPEEAEPKGPTEPWRERWSLEVGVGLQLHRDDAFNARLETFGFESDLDLAPSPSFAVALAWRFHPNVSAVLGWTMLESRTYRRSMFDLDQEERRQVYTWSAHEVGLSARGTLPIARDVFELYLQGGFGFTVAESNFHDELPASPVDDDELHWGWHVSAALGAQVMPWDHFGFFAQAGYTYAPTVENLLGDVHDSGGALFHVGIRGAL